MFEFQSGPSLILPSQYTYESANPYVCTIYMYDNIIMKDRVQRYKTLRENAQLLDSEDSVAPTVNLNNG